MLNEGFIYVGSSVSSRMLTQVPQCNVQYSWIFVTWVNKDAVECCDLGSQSYFSGHFPSRAWPSFIQNELLVDLTQDKCDICQQGKKIPTTCTTSNSIYCTR